MKEAKALMRTDYALSPDEIRERLLMLQDVNYQKFHSSLLPGIENVLGVRTPELRKLTKEICRGDWEQFLAGNDREWYEKDVLQGLVIAGAKMPLKQRLELTKAFLPRINNWAVCDIFCGSFKEARKHKEEVWEFLQPCLQAKEEYVLRFGVVMLLSHFAEETYVRAAFDAFDRIRSEAYYVKMAVAWAISVYFVHCPERTWEYLYKNQLDNWTYNKALQKILESYRVDEMTKQKIRSMKRKQKQN